jgi:xanthine phosphoribosyltransferase
VAVARGGLVPAAVVARELDLRVIETCCVVAYDAADRPSDKVRLVKPPIAAEDGAGWLVIDDLVDTGRTAEAVRATLPRAHFGTVYAKPAGRALVDSFVTLVAQETWILFPWDMDLRFVPPIAAVEP